MIFSKAQALQRTQQGEDGDRKDFFSYPLHAKDPEGGQGFTLSELWAESNLLIHHRWLRHSSNGTCRHLLLPGPPSSDPAETRRRDSLNLHSRRRDRQLFLYKAGFLRISQSLHRRDNAHGPLCHRHCTSRGPQRGPLGRLRVHPRGHRGRHRILLHPPQPCLFQRTVPLLTGALYRSLCTWRDTQKR